MDKKSLPKHIISRSSGSIQTVVYGLLFLIFLAIAAVFAFEASYMERVIYVRYWHFIAAGFFAFIIPHILFPVARIGWLQSLNPKPKSLRNMQLSELFPIFWIFTASYFILAFFAPAGWSADLAEKSRLFGEAALFFIGLFIYAYYRYSIIGKRSQEWSEGKRGASFLQNMAKIGQSSATPAGMYPTFGATAGIASLGMILVVFNAWLGAQIGVFSIIVYVLFLGYAIMKLQSATRIFDRHLYQTSSFYDELFRNPSGYLSGDREPLKAENVYWVPNALKASVWAVLSQLDRRLPFGRVMILLVLMLWTLFYAGLSLFVIQGLILAVIIVKNATIFLTASSRISPLGFNYSLHSVTTWCFVRFFANLRWVLPLFLGLATVSLFSARFTFYDSLIWAGIDILTALLFAVVSTLSHEGKYTSRYA